MEDLAILKKVCTLYDDSLELKPLQRECLLHILNDGGDVVFNVPTGYGKSLIFHLLPWLLQEKLKLEVPAAVIVISPLNVIQQDQLMKLTSKGMQYFKLIIYSMS